MSADQNALSPSAGTPSLVRQRIFLVVFATLIVLAVWWQSAVGSSNYPPRKFSPTPVNLAELDFSGAEAAWSSLQIDPQGNLQIDSRTETALADAIALVQNQPSEQAAESAMARTALLLEKQFGATATPQILALLAKLKNYKSVEQRFWAENGNKNPPPHEELFQLQDELLGKTLAQTLFSEQRHLAKVMLTSQKIQNDASLTPAQKQRALMELQNPRQAEPSSVE